MVTLAKRSPWMESVSLTGYIERAGVREPGGYLTNI